MTQFEHKEDLARFFQCSSVLEERVASAYKHLADRVENAAVKALLQYVMHDTYKHSDVLREIGNAITRLEVNAGDCEGIMGKVWKTLTTNSMQELSQKEKITNKQLVFHVDAMKNLENCFAEEYLTIIHTKSVKLIAQQHHIDLGNHNTILEWIIEDEKRHEQTLIMIKNILIQQKKPDLTEQNSTQLEPTQTNAACRADNCLRTTNLQRTLQNQPKKTQNQYWRKPT